MCALLLAPLPRYVSLYSLFVFTHSQHACANEIMFRKFIDILPVFLLGKRQTERRALSLGGRTAGRASDLRKRALDLMGEKEDRGSPFLIFPSNPSASTATAPPQRQRGRCCEDAGENSLLKESFPPPPRAKHTQWKPLIMRAVGSLESRPCMLHSQSDHRKNCVYPARDIAWAGRNTQSLT